MGGTEAPAPSGHRRSQECPPQARRGRQRGGGPAWVQGQAQTHTRTHTLARQLAQALSMQPTPGEGPPLLLHAQPT